MNLGIFYIDPLILTIILNSLLLNPYNREFSTIENLVQSLILTIVLNSLLLNPY